MTELLAEDISVCTDCAMLSANGELGQGDETADIEHAGRMAEQWPDGWVVLSGAEDCEPWFSGSPCQGCGSHLAGDRHAAAVLAR